MASSVMSNCEALTEMGQFYAVVERLLDNVLQLTTTTNQLKQENDSLRSELKQTREWLFQLNEMVAEQGLKLKSFDSPQPSQILDKNEDCGWP